MNLKDEVGECELDSSGSRLKPVEGLCEKVMNFQLETACLAEQLLPSQEEPCSILQVLV
jgi:hypothetical protein